LKETMIVGIVIVWGWGWVWNENILK